MLDKEGIANKKLNEVMEELKGMNKLRQTQKPQEYIDKVAKKMLSRTVFIKGVEYDDFSDSAVSEPV